MMHENLKGILFQITPIEVFEEGEIFSVIIQIPMNFGWMERVKFSVLNNGEYQMEHKKNENRLAFFETTVKLKTKAIYHYYFSFEANGVFMCYKKVNITGNNAVISEECWKMSVNFEVAQWAKGKIMYHIFIDRYCRSIDKVPSIMPKRKVYSNWNDEMIVGPDKDGNWNIDFFCGDLKGIEKSLKYLKSLSVSIIYLSPICMSQSNHRYDCADYTIVDMYAGSNEDLISLCNSAHRKGIKIILDGVFNHTGNDSIYFNQYGTYDTIGAYQSESSPYYKFYRTYYENGVHKFSYWWGMLNLPECDCYSKEWQDYICEEGGIIDKWFSLGIDGLRLDVADELSDEFIEKVRIAVKRNREDGFIMGEVWKNPMRMNRGYISSGKGMHSVMNYPLANALIRYIKYADKDILINTIKEIKTEYPEDTIYSLMNFTSTHDISRAIDIFAIDDYFQRYGEWAWNLTNSDLNWCRNFKLTSNQYKHGRDVFELYVFILAFMPGTLSIFYGDEVGVQGIGNLANRRQYPWGKRDKKLLKFFREIGKVRRNHSFLETAEMEIIDINERYMLFERYNKQEKIIIATNRTNENIKLVIPDTYGNSNVVLSLKRSIKDMNLFYLTSYGAIAAKETL